MNDDNTQAVMKAANTLRQLVPKLVENYLDALPDEADAGFESMYYEGLHEEVNELFDALMGLCTRYRSDRQSDGTGEPWRPPQPTK